MKERYQMLPEEFIEGDEVIREINVVILLELEVGAFAWAPEYGHSRDMEQRQVNPLDTTY